jgi:hypothetical protein
MDDVPFRESIEAWNTAHSSDGTPAEFEQRLKVGWHAHAHQDGGLASTADAAFWKVDNTFDSTYGGVTNILLRFDTNPSAQESLIPFQVYAQPEVRTIVLTLSSNIESLSGTYKLTLR